MRRPRLVLATAAVAAASSVLLAACGGGAPSSSAVLPPDDASTASSGGIAKVDSIAALVPPTIASRGTLVVGTDTTYAPAEYIDVDGVTPVGYDVDFANAIATVLGLKADVRTANFSDIIPAVGTTYDVGISSFTINADRMAQANMVQYIQAGEAFAVERGNPKSYSRDDLCGRSVAVQTGTIEEEELGTLADKCASDGKAAIKPVSFAAQTDATAALVDGKVDVMYADSPIIAYAITETGNRIEMLGDVFENAPEGIVVAKDDQALTNAIQKAVQHLIDSGGYNDILTGWATQPGAVTKAEINPAVS